MIGLPPCSHPGKLSLLEYHFKIWKSSLNDEDPGKISNGLLMVYVDGVDGV